MGGAAGAWVRWAFAQVRPGFERSMIVLRVRAARPEAFSCVAKTPDGAKRQFPAGAAQNRYAVYAWRAYVSAKPEQKRGYGVADSVPDAAHAAATLTGHTCGSMPKAT